MQGVLAYTSTFGGRKMAGGCSGGYTFNFNGQERDDEVYGAGNAYSFEYRVHDPRLGRFLSVDPSYRDYPWNSTYAFAENDVIRAKDLEGAEKYIVIYANLENKTTITVLPYSTLHPGKDNGPMGKGTASFINDKGKFQYKRYFSPGRENQVAVYATSIGDWLFSGISDEKIMNQFSGYEKTHMKRLTKWGGKLTQAMPYLAIYLEGGGIKDYTEQLGEDIASNAISGGNVVLSMFVNLIMESAKQEDGLMNLKNGRMADSYRSSRRQMENYWDANFNTQFNNKTYEEKIEGYGKNMEGNLQEFFKPAQIEPVKNNGCNLK